jgi:hypothetical protein
LISKREELVSFSVVHDEKPLLILVNEGADKS